MLFFRMLGGLLMAAICTPALGAQWRDGQAQWRDPDVLVPMSLPSMVYDPLRDRLVLYQSELDFTRILPGGTWEWDGSSWTRCRPVHDPGPRRGHAMAFDPRRGTVLLFGGRVNHSSVATLRNDLWEWDGNDWRLVPTVHSPPPLTAARMAYDWRRGRIVLFGGMLSMSGLLATISDQTWEWDGTTWTQRFPQTVPGRRYGQGLAFNPATQRVAMYGGSAGFAPWPDGTWEWDGNDWLRMAVTAEPPGTCGMFETDWRRGSVIMQGGPDPTYPHDQTWEWTGTIWHKLSPVHSPPRDLGSLSAFDAKRQRILKFLLPHAGRPFWVPTMWQWDGTDWQQIYTREPLFLNTIAHDAGRDEFVMVGRNADSYPYTLPIRTFVAKDIGEPIEVHPAQSPPKREGCAAVYHAGIGKVVLYGGRSSDHQSLNDTWLWDGSTWTEHRSATPPPAKGGTVMVYDSARQKLVLLTQLTMQTWEWEPVNGWSQVATPTTPPLDCRFNGLAFDPVRQRTVLSGMWTKAGAFGVRETWEWDGTQWQRMNHPTPTPVGGTTVYVPDLGGVLWVLAGPWQNQQETWLWDGIDWKRLQVPGEELLIQFAYPPGLVYDPNRKRVWAYGLSGLPTNPETSHVEFFVESLRVNQPLPRPGDALRFDIDLPANASQFFVSALSLGAYPGIPLRAVPYVGQELLPLAPDPLLTASLQSGRLDVIGHGSALYALPPDPALVDLSFHAAAFTLQTSPLQVTAITNRVPLRIVR